MANFNFIVFMLFLGSMLAMCASKCPRIRKRKNLRPKYQSQKRVVYFKCKRGFELIGAVSAICKGDEWSAEYPICVASGCPPLAYDQNILDVTYTYRGSLATFQCKANYVMEDEDNRVYCNKFKWNKPPPTCIKNTLKKSCDYEDGICGWTQDQLDQFDWEIHSKETSTKFTGPSNDHTYGNSSEGHYIYIESSAPRRPGDQARVLSPMYNFQMQVVCFEFWFHMQCPLLKEFGTLQVYAIPENKSLGGLAPLLTLSGDYGDVWNRERVQIEPIQGSFRVVLEATRRLSHQNDIAVDDIQLWEFPCDEVPNKTYPLQSETEISSKPTTLSTSMGTKSAGTIISEKETIATTEIESTVSTSVYGVRKDKITETIATQTTSTKMPIIGTSLSSETKEKKVSMTTKISVTRTDLSPETKENKVSITNATETTDFISQKGTDSSSMASVTIAEAEDQVNNSDKFPIEQSSEANVKGNISAKNSIQEIENYTPLAIGITVALLFGIGVIFFIVWIWARSQDKKRAMAEDEEETQPITNAGSNCSLQNGF